MKLLLSALEPSANLHLDPLLKKLPDVQLEGIFDRRFGTPLFESRAFSVMGFVDALKKLPLAQKALTAMIEAAASCDVVVLIDSPAFNIPLAKRLKAAYPHKPILYYILPQVWAWKAKRVAVVEQNSDKQALVLPFEKRWWRAGVYVGHPLLEEIEHFKDRATHEAIYTFMPGSRKGEISRLWPIFKEVAQALEGEKIVVIPPHMSAEEIAHHYGDLSDFTLSRDAHSALARAQFAFVCSGTATLEAALIGTPLVLAYRAKWLDFQIARRFVKLPFVGLGNLIAHFEKRPPLFEEFLQEEANASNLLEALHRSDPDQFLTRSQELRTLLKGRDCDLGALILELAGHQLEGGETIVDRSKIA